MNPNDIDDLSLDAPCFLCGRPIGEGDEPGLVPMNDGAGPWVPNCSEACADAWFAAEIPEETLA